MAVCYQSELGYYFLWKREINLTNRPYVRVLTQASRHSVFVRLIYERTVNVSKTCLNNITSSPVFHSLLKAHAVEARAVVRQALEILTPAMPQRMEDGNTMLTHWTKKIFLSV